MGIRLRSSIELGDGNRLHSVGLRSLWLRYHHGFLKETIGSLEGDGRATLGSGGIGCSSEFLGVGPDRLGFRLFRDPIREGDGVLEVGLHLYFEGLAVTIDGDFFGGKDGECAAGNCNILGTICAIGVADGA